MATKEKTRRLPLPGRKTVRLSRRGMLRCTEAGVAFLLGGVLSGAEIFGLYAPFGVAAVAAAGSGLTGVGALLGSCLGYLTLEGMTDGMRYAASAILTYSVAFAFYDAKFYQKAWFMPSIAAFLCALTGIITRGGEGWYGEDLVYFVTEVIFTAVAAYCYSRLFSQWPETFGDLQNAQPGQGAGVLLLGSTLLMSLARVELLETFSLGRLLAAVGVMLGARRGVGGGVLVGACGGVALDLASGQAPYYSMIFTLAGLACGLCRERGKLLTAAVYVGASSIAVLWTWSGGERLGMPIESVIAAVAFLFIPIRTAPSPEETPPAAGEAAEGVQLALTEKLEELASAFHTLHDNIKDALRPDRDEGENPGVIFDRAADKVCARCVLNTACWQKEYETTRSLLNDATGQLMERGRALPSDFNGHFTSRCVKFPEFLSEVNRQLTAFLRRRQELARTQETRAALCGQYAHLDRLISQAAAEVSSGLTPDLPRQERLRDFLRSRNLPGGAVYYDQGGRLRAETPVDEDLMTRSGRRELAQVIGTPLGEGEKSAGRLVFTQAEPFRATVAAAGQPRTGETVSGDTGTWFKRGDGILFLLLCDGMGSGVGAKNESSQAARLIESFLRAGMEPDQAMETVASALALRGAEGGSTTVDLLSVDLFSGKCCIYKQGAAPSYVRRSGQVRCAVGSSLPAGLVTGERARPDSHKFRGEAGDWVVLVTDGVLCGREDGWIREVLAGYTGTSPVELAETVLRRSKELHQGEDDATVLALRLEKRREKE